MTGAAVPQIKRRLRRDVQELRVLLATFDLGMHPGQRLLIVVSDMLIKSLVFVFGDLTLGACPECAGLIDGFFFAGGLHSLGVFIPAFFGHTDRQGNMIRVLAQNFTDFPAVNQVFLLGTQMQNHFGTAGRVIDVGNGIITLAAGHPFHTGIGGGAGFTATYGHFIGDDEGRIEAHTELANQVGIFLIIPGQCREKFLGAGFGDGAQVGNRFILGHPDTIVGNGDGFGISINQNAQTQLRVVFKQGRVGQSFIA